ncbi:hypothetical protein [Olleya sp. YS]|uniref:hypothetical protein n=1 Tax=Olleya sp. YS TaxID=3028318 RepID=UPI0024344EF6|nr:hypothetical protein [Olleya sp. YS]WGD33932.1 hypothetical protein Ollyesu_09085 [Olleya sp. YS]
MTSKQLQLVMLSLFLCVVVNAQESTKAVYPLKADVETLDGIINAYYDVISGPANQARNWERDASLHHPDALITVTGKDKDNTPYIITQTLEEYHKSFGIPEAGFFEYELKREVQTFGNITHVWTYYETREEENGPVVDRGINSIQLYYDGNRWWILSWMFDNERKDNPLNIKSED